MHIPGLSPTFIRSDFELAAINALKNVFHGAQISCCNFNLAWIVKKKYFSLKVEFDFKKIAKSLH